MSKKRKIRGLRRRIARLERRIAYLETQVLSSRDSVGVWPATTNLMDNMPMNTTGWKAPH